MRTFALAAVCALLLCGLAFADKIILKSGQEISAEIIAEKDDKLIVDLGVDILVIPKADVAEYQYGHVAEANDTPEPNQVQTKDPTKLYYTVDPQFESIEKCVERVSQAVVKVSTPGGMGSGFFINEDGYLITNYHVIERETRIEITMFKKTEDGFEKKKFKKVKIEALNPFVDLALLKIEDIGDEKIKYVPLGTHDRITVGQTVFAIGNPLGLERTVTDGVISTTNRSFEGLVYVQTNADINPGNSGGPLFNLAGEVVGVTNMGYIFFGGLGFAIPTNYVKHFIDNREAFAYDKDNPNTGYRYTQPAKRVNKSEPEFLKK